MIWDELDQFNWCNKWNPLHRFIGVILSLQHLVVCCHDIRFQLLLFFQSKQMHCNIVLIVDLKESFLRKKSRVEWCYAYQIFLPFTEYFWIIILLLMRAYTLYVLYTHCQSFFAFESSIGKTNMVKFNYKQQVLFQRIHSILLLFFYFIRFFIIYILDGFLLKKSSQASPFIACLSCIRFRFSMFSFMFMIVARANEVAKPFQRKENLWEKG